MHEPLRFDHYRVLGVLRTASTKEIKQAYRERVKGCHPDRNPSPQAATLFHAVHKAYQELGDPVRREAYDNRLQFYRHTHSGPLYNASHAHERTFQRGSVDRPVNRFAFVGLHITGLCFGVTMILGILVGVTFFSWPVFTLVFCLPGLVVIPDSLAGLRLK